MIIGFLIPSISYPLGKSLFDGVVAAVEDGKDRALCFLGNPEKTHNLFHWYDMTLSPEISGLIIYGGGLGQFENEEELSFFLERFKSKPMLNIGYPLKGFNNLCVDNYRGMKDLVLHMIEVHNHHDIALVRGPEGHPEAHQRLQGYRDALESRNISFNPDYVIPGDFTIFSGREAAKTIYRLWQDKKITAVAFSSDSMALAGMQELGKMGVSFPDDLAVVSFDNADEAVSQMPGLTTADQRAYKQGRKAVKTIRRMIEKGDEPENILFPAKLIIRESCGCMPDMIKKVSIPADLPLKEMIPLPPKFLNDIEDSDLEKMIARLKSDINRETESDFLEFLISFKPLSDYLNNAGSQSKVLRQFQDYISLHRSYSLDKFSSEQQKGMEKVWHQMRVFISMQLEYALTSKKVRGDYLMRSLNNISNQFISSPDMKTIRELLDDHLDQFKVDLCGVSLFEDRDLRTACSLEYLYSKENLAVDLPLNYSSSRIIPEELSASWSRGSLIISPLISQNQYWGNMFFIIRDKITVNDGVFIESLTSQIASALQQIQLVEERNRAIKQLEDAYLGLEIMNRKLEDLSFRDDLTGLLNRRGFMALSSRLIQECREKGSDFLLLFADLDGLKTINDTYGHEEGDFAIFSIGEIIKSSCRDGDIIARLGGDEFVALIPNIPENYDVILEKRLQKARTHLIRKYRKPYKISCSFGFVLGSEFPDKSLSFLMVTADTRLYSQKANKKKLM